MADKSDMPEVYILVGTQMIVRRGRVCMPGTYPCLRTTHDGEISPFGLLCVWQCISLSTKSH
jgi:hypothetical protein